jgi:hypothetical protein
MKKLILLLLISSVLFAYNVRSEASDLVVHSYPEDALVFIDEIGYGRTPTRLPHFHPGHHSIKLQKTGYVDYLDSFDNVSGTDKEIFVNLTKINYPLETQPSTSSPYDFKSEESELVVDSSPAEASVFIDGMYRGTTPLRLPNFRPGYHSIALHKDGYGPLVDSFKKVSGTKKEIFLNLKMINARSKSDQIPQSGKLIVRTDPIGAEIYIKEANSLWVDGQIRILSEEKDLPPGRYDIRVDKQGYFTWWGNAIIGAGEKSEIFARLLEKTTRPDSSPSREGRPSQSNPKNNAVDDLTTIFNDAALAIQGYDLQCVRAIRDMVKEGTMSPAQGQYLMSQTCKNKTDTGSFGTEPMPSMGCPICGLMGQMKMGLNGTYYVCPRGHAWR